MRDESSHVTTLNYDCIVCFPSEGIGGRGRIAQPYACLRPGTDH
jgi:hypothetical protein